MRTFAVAARVLAQLRRDPRTIALIVGVPMLLETLLKEIFADRPVVFQHVGAPLLGLFPFVTMFLVTSITMLRERTTGTLERLMASPLRKLDLLAGYGLAFAAVAMLQAAAVSALAFGALGLEVSGPKEVVTILAVANAVLGTALGLFVSAFAQTEFQAVQFMPAMVFPQMLLCGLLVDRGSMATWLRWISDACRSRTPTTRSPTRPPTRSTGASRPTWPSSRAASSSRSGSARRRCVAARRSRHRLGR